MGEEKDRNNRELTPLRKAEWYINNDQEMGGKGGYYRGLTFYDFSIITDFV